MTSSESTFDIRLHQGPHGWRVAIVESNGEVLAERACQDGAEARTFASTVRQHLYWLSPQAFRSYYTAGR